MAARATRASSDKVFVIAHIFGALDVTRRIVAFVGPIGAGKTEAATTLARVGPWRHISFASPLKELVARITVDGKIDKLRDRPLLQFVGEQYYRALDPSHWLDLFAARVRDAHEAGYDVVVDDARYDNELNYIASKQGEIYYIYNPRADEHAAVRDGGPVNTLPGHGSNRLSAADTRIRKIINNSGSLEQFHTRVLAIKTEAT